MLDESQFGAAGYGHEERLQDGPRRQHRWALAETLKVRVVALFAAETELAAGKAGQPSETLLRCRSGAECHCYCCCHRLLPRRLPPLSGSLAAPCVRLARHAAEPGSKLGTMSERMLMQPK